MKYLLFIIVILSFMSLTLLGGDQTLQSININPVLEISGSNSIDMTSQDGGEVLHVSKKAILTLKDFSHAKVAVNEGVPTLNLDLKKAGEVRIKEFTSHNVGKRLAFIVNGNLINAPKVKVPITGNGLSIDPVEKAVADRLAEQINNQN